MRAHLFPAVLFLTALSLSAAEPEKQISWVPHFVTVQAEGAYLQRVFFTDGQHRYGLSLDTETQVEAGDGGARFTFPKVPSATFTLHAAPKPFTLPPPTELKALEEYRRQAMAFAPEGATDFANLREHIDALNINDWKSYRLTYSYNFFGLRHRRSVTYLAFPSGQQAVFEVAALETEFADAMGRAEHLIRTWHSLAATSTEPPRS